MSKYVFLVSILLVLGRLPSQACSSTGFNIHAIEDVEFEDGSAVRGLPAAYVNLRATWQSDLQPNPTGNIYQFTGSTDFQGHASAPGARVPAIWRITETSGNCNGQYVDEPVPGAGAIVDIYCTFTNVPIYNANPNTWLSNDSPYVTVSGSGISMTYGTPIVAVMSTGGTCVSQDNNPSCGTGWVGCSMYMTTGYYWAMVLNKTSSGDYEAVGGARVNVQSCGPKVCQ